MIRGRRRGVLFSVTLAVGALTGCQMLSEKPRATQAAPVAIAAKTGDGAGADMQPEAPSPAGLACEAAGGAFVRTGHGLQSCQSRTRDAGKSCRTGSDCDGACLARSMSCAPVRPLFGCNDVVEDDGRRVSLCID